MRNHGLGLMKLSRTHLHTDSHSLPGPGTAGRPALLAVSLILPLLAVLFAACSSDPEGIAVRGRSIEIHAERPIIIDKFSYSYNDDGDIGHRVVRPRASNRELAAVLVTVVNRTSTVMPLLVDSDAAELGDRRSDRLEALDPFDRFSEVSFADEDEDRFSPLLWGQIQLDRKLSSRGLGDLRCTQGPDTWHSVVERSGRGRRRLRPVRQTTLVPHPLCAIQASAHDHAPSSKTCRKPPNIEYNEEVEPANSHTADWSFEWHIQWR